MKGKAVTEVNPHQKTNFKGEKGFSGMRKAWLWLSMGYWWA
jgi:hypothetical protein